MNPFAGQLLDTIRRHQLLEPNERVLVAVSGGCDSVVLLRWLYALAEGEGWRLEVAHFNHCLRGIESDADEAWVKALADSLSLPCHVGRGDPRALAEAEGISIEMAARALRHRFLAEAAREQGIGKVALGHHADDQVETFLLRLLRGTSGEGAGGMHWSAVSPVAARIRLVRPLLDCSREAVSQVARAAGWTWREDSTNSLRDALRNRIRHELVPLLQANYQPALREVIRRFMDVTAAEAECVAHAARDWLDLLSEDPRGTFDPTIPPSTDVGSSAVRPTFSEVRKEAGTAYDALPPAVKRQVLLRQLRKLGVATDFGLVERLLEAGGVKTEVAPGRRVWRDERGLVHEDAVGESDFRPDRLTVGLGESSGEVDFAGLRIQWDSCDAPAGGVP
ncbi:MAG: tRNA lysidine(34) synthetase TilS, partial [Verrucomicrobiae bacterium]|nr:tRNA lysidine(34) synthetase TilS [Verrucomicrobiae bacterium]